MPNPFTRFINRSDPDSDLARFIEAWDELEALLIDVFRSGVATEADERDWTRIQAALVGILPEIQDRLAPPARTGLIPEILNLSAAREMVGNRRILRLLPDVREAINRTLLTD